MLVTIATCGWYSRNDRSLSSASATKYSPVPWWAFEPTSEISPPITKDGSRPACCRIRVAIEVVVVLPCVPAIAIVRRPAMAAARASERCSTRSPRARASTSSRWSAGIAVEYTTVSTPSRLDGSCRMWMVPPSARSAASAGQSRSSLPETGMPRVSSNRASPLMPTPPTPIRCTRPSSSAVSWTSVPLIWKPYLQRPAADSRSASLRDSCRPPAKDRRQIRAPLRESCRHHLEDEGPQRLVAVAPAVPGGRGAHRRQPRLVAHQRHDHPLDPVRRQVGVFDQQATAGLHHGKGVAALFTVAPRQRYVDRRHPDRRGLRTRHRAAPAQRQVGRRVPQLHPRQELQRHVRRRQVRRDLDRLVASTDDMKHLNAGRRDRLRGAGHGGV